MAFSEAVSCCSKENKMVMNDVSYTGCLQHGQIDGFNFHSILQQYKLMSVPWISKSAIAMQALMVHRH